MRRPLTIFTILSTLSLCLFFGLIQTSPVAALYFYLPAGESKCFLEELPNHTIVVGQSDELASLVESSYMGKQAITKLKNGQKTRTSTLSTTD